jgi:hypothetical protein
MLSGGYRASGISKFTKLALSSYHETSYVIVRFCSLKAAYGDQMIARHGEGYDWRNAPIDPEAVYSSGGGKPHGRLDFFKFQSNFII